MTRDEVKNFAKLMKSYFPIYKNNPDLCYLDSGATSLKPQVVLDKMNEYYSTYGVNIHRGVYKLSYKATLEYDNAREKVASFINSKFEEVIFTKNVSEALNEAAIMLSRELNEEDEILSCFLEHHSSCLPWLIQAKEKNLKLKYIPLNEEGRVTVDALKNTITPKSKILAITLVSNVLGYKTEIEEFIKIAHEHNMIVVVDAAQAIQHYKIDVKALDCDFLAFSGHKMFGPTGIGVLYGKKKLLKKLTPVYYGGDMNEEVYLDDVDVKETPFGFEVGTPMIAEAIGLGRAIDFINEIGLDKIKAHDEAMVKYIKEKIKDVYGITVYNKDMDTPIISFNIDGVHPHDAASFFDEDGICLRAGHHCAQLLTKWLKVNGTLRASFYVYNDFDDVDKLINTIKKVVEFFKEFK